MKTSQNWLFYMIGVMMLLSLFGCGKKKYRLILEDGFTSARTAYAEGEKVRVYFDLIATDTDYRFFSNDVKLKQGYEEKRGFVFSFTMPSHDVKIQYSSRNSMVYDPDAEKEETEKDLIAQIDQQNMVFDYYEATTGTDGYDGYDEFVLYRRQKSGLILASYSKWNGEEKVRACLVPEDLLYSALAAADEYDMRRWKDGYPIDGMTYVVRFCEGDTMIRAASDNMPENGRQAFYAVKKVFLGAWEKYGPKE